MGQKIIVGPFTRGLKNDVIPVYINNESFPVIINGYQWRGRAKRKRGTTLLGRLKRFFNSTSGSYNSGTTTFNLDGTGAGNLLVNASWTLQANGNIIPTSVTITIGANIYTDPNANGTLTGPNPGTINYATGEISIPLEAGNAASAVFNYNPDLPVMGLKDFVITSSQFPGTIGFDTVYSYNILPTFPYNIYDVSFYKNPPTGTYAGYTQKAVVTPTSWNGQDYQQFWTVNYQGALWATNGITIPFTTTNIGMQFKRIGGFGVFIIAAGPPAIVQIETTTEHGLIGGDFIFVNEIVGNTGINFQTGYVTGVATPFIVTVEFPNAFIDPLNAYVSGGIVQYLTSRANPDTDGLDPTRDCLKWYDGDPTNGNPTTPVLNGQLGWVNFMPPISQSIFSISDLPSKQYYLVGARMIFPFKDRLLFLGPVVQASGVGDVPIYLQDTIVYSQNGTPYYTASYENDPLASVDNPTSPTNIFNPILVPTNQTATPSAYFSDSTGFGGFITAGIDQEIVSVSSNEDVLIVGFSREQTRLVYSGNDVVPFNFFIINSEYGSGSTFSAINLDKGVITRGGRGFVITSQTETQRIDLDIPDEVFQMRLIDNGTERVTAQRDFINEWMYFTYPVNSINYKFPTQTLLYNYRDETWGLFRESYTTYGSFRKATGFTWATVGTVFPSWSEWNQPWNAGGSTLLQPDVIGGNQQGFVLIRADGTGEGNSLYIKSFSTSVVTSPDHCLNEGDFIIITGCIGSVGEEVNGKIFSISNPSQNTFILSPTLSSGLTYFGGGVIKRIYRPFIQSKQFPVSWEAARKTRLGPQQYLLTKTARSQITLQIFLSQDSENPWNSDIVIPQANSPNDSLIYSSVLYTCPESTNLGLTPANINLNMVTASSQEQIWHRMNTSLLGDTVQVAITLSNEQLRNLDPIGDPVTITGATQANPCVLTAVNFLSANQLIRITGVQGMIQLNNRNFNILSATPTSITIEVDSSGFTAYSSGGLATPIAPINQFAEIELHSMILDVSPSGVLA